MKVSRSYAKAFNKAAAINGIDHGRERRPPISTRTIIYPLGTDWNYYFGQPTYGTIRYRRERYGLLWRKARWVYEVYKSYGMGWFDYALITDADPPRSDLDWRIE